MRWRIEEAFKALKIVIGLNATLYHKSVMTEVRKQLWMCACLHRISQMIKLKLSGIRNKPVNAVDIIVYVLEVLSSLEWCGKPAQIRSIQSSHDRARKVKHKE